jgi:hypothetical protein
VSIQVKLPEHDIDARTFQVPLGELGTAIAYKVQREGRERLPQPAFVTEDIYMLLRQALHIYGLSFYLNADERRQGDENWRTGYSAAILPLVRCLIDCLYNVTAILESPEAKGHLFRESGYKRILLALDANEERYGKDPKWSDWIAYQRRIISNDMRMSGFTEPKIRAAPDWPTLSQYVRTEKGTNQQFLKKLTLAFWQEYSGMAHATFQGLMATAIFLIPKDFPHEERPQLEADSEMIISVHLNRTAAILLCVLSEVQAYFRFDGAHINQRLRTVWSSLLRVPEVKELYDGRYAQLMQERGISPD